MHISNHALRYFAVAFSVMACAGAAAADDEPGLDSGEGSSFTRGGFLQFDMARTYAGKDHWSMARALSG